jgi:hypothetical protein
MLLLLLNVEQLRLLLLLHSLKLMLVCRWGQVLVVLLTLQSVGGKMCGRIELVIAAVGFCVKDLLLLGRLSFRSTPDLSHLIPSILHQGLKTQQGFQIYASSGPWFPYGNLKQLDQQFFQQTMIVEKGLVSCSTLVMV